MHRPSAASFLTGFLVLGALPVAASAQSFTLIPLPSGETGTRAYGVSADGSVVAGSSANAAGLGPGWTWTASGGAERVRQTEPGLPPDTWAAGISGDGSTVVGQSGGAQGSDPKLPYIYRGPGTFQTLPLVDPYYTRGRATDASYDGSVVVGYDNEGTTFSTSQAFRWTAAGGMQGLGWTRGSHSNSEANAVSADGNTVVGTSWGSSAQAFIWTPQTGMQELPGGNNTYAYAISSDARFVAGENNIRHGVLWHDGVMEDLGAPSGVSTSAYAVSDDGNTVAGYFYLGSPGYRAAFWRRGIGWMTIRDYLAASGINLPGNINPYIATSMSVDGKTIVGYMQNLTTGHVQAFVATVPAPSAVPLLAMCASGLLARRRR